MNNDNRLLSKINIRHFSHPHLPRELVILSILVVLTNVFAILIGQPDEYWVDHTYARSSVSPIHFIVAIHPLLFLIIGMAYVAIIGLFLDGLSIFPAFVLWTAICSIHLVDILAIVIRILNSYLHMGSLVHGIVTLGLSIILVGLLGIALVKTTIYSDKAKTDTEIESTITKPRSAQNRLLVGSVFWVILLSIMLIASMNKRVPGWQKITSDQTPGPRSGAEVAYDIDRKRAVLFGGTSAWLGTGWQHSNETWEWNGDDWQQVLTDQSPTARRSMGMAYDEKRKVMVLFGGLDDNNYMGDTWEWDGQEWIQSLTSAAPSARAYHRMLYHPQLEKVILYGGYDGETFYNDAWAWNGEQWQQMPFETKSPEASGFIMFYDQAQDHIVAHLGWNGTWFWWQDIWGKSQMELQPVSSTGMPIAYDPINQRAIMFGGTQSEYFDETWIYEDMMWWELDTPFEPPPRWGHVSFFDHIRGRAVIFGGYDGETFFADMWELQLSD